MNELLPLLAKVITLDLFMGYGVYTLIWLVMSSTKWNTGRLEGFDRKASRFIKFTGILYVLVVATSIIYSAITDDDYQIRWYPLIQVLIWVTVTQLVAIESIRKNRILRLVFAILFMISFELFVIIVTSMHRDYADGISSSILTIEALIGLTTKMVVFCVFAIVHSFIAEKMKGLRAG